MSLIKFHSADMTEGAIHPHLVQFALPLLAGNLFQQFYNTVDSIVVGNFVGKEALAAVGSTTPLITMIIGFFMGLATGGGVVISQYFGAHDIAKLRRTVHTMILGTAILGVVLTALGIAISPVMLRAMSTPSDVFDEATVYLRIYFSGVAFLMLYNVGSGILRAVGDSARPFYFLVASSLVNVALDVFFVVVIGMGVEGVAYATIISEAISMILVFIFLVRTDECCKLSWKEMKISGDSVRRILQIGLPGGIQMSVTSFSNVFVQGYINRFGSSCMAGWATYGKIDQFAMLPMQSIAMSSTTFTGQNFGAGKLDRVKEGVAASFHLTLGITFAISVFLFALARPFAMLFNKDENVIYYGVYFLRMISPFYLLVCSNQIYAGTLRGLGHSTAPMVIMLSSFVVFRQIYLFVTTHLTDSLLPVSIAYPMGWLVCSIAMAIFYRRVSRRIFSA